MKLVLEMYTSCTKWHYILDIIGCHFSEAFSKCPIGIICLFGACHTLEVRFPKIFSFRNFGVPFKYEYLYLQSTNIKKFLYFVQFLMRNNNVVPFVTFHPIYVQITKNYALSQPLPFQWSHVNFYDFSSISSHLMILVPFCTQRFIFQNCNSKKRI